MSQISTRIYLHIIISVHEKRPLLGKLWRSDLYHYIGGLIRNHGHTLIAINGADDHIHMLIRFVPTESIGDLINAVKSSSIVWLRQQRYINPDFRWQNGYSAFSNSRSQLGGVIRYIDRQEQHHRRRSFHSEYRDLLSDSEALSRPWVLD